MKQCSKCGVEKAEAEFYRTKRSKDGLYSQCKACHIECTVAWKRANPEKAREVQRDLDSKRDRDPVRNRKKYLASQKRGAAQEYRRRRKLRLKGQCPSWCDRAAVSAFYQGRAEGVVVDHIVPINGEQVSGLHVRSNLQYLSAEINLVKSNHFEPKWEIFRPDLLRAV